MKGFRTSAFFFFAFTCLLLQAQAPAKEAKWFQGSSDHFILFTDTSEVKAQRLLIDLESRVGGFATVVGSMRPAQFPVEVFLFKNREDYLALAPKREAVNGFVPPANDAYLFVGPDRLFLIAMDVSTDNITNDAAHALGHALFNHEVIWRPFWLSEGIAEYLRKLGRSADTKAVPEKDGYKLDELLTIVPSGDYQDSDPGGAFRTQSYRLLRLLLEEKPQALRTYIAALDREDGDIAKLDIDVEDMSRKFETYVETPLKLIQSGAAVKTSPADPVSLSIHRGDLYLAINQTAEAGRLYKGDSREALAARAILTRFSRLQGESLVQLERAAQDLPEFGLVQYHFGAMETNNKKDLDAQAVALEKAVKLLPFFGRADAELARVYARTGRAAQSLALVGRALELEPEYADQYYAIRADVLVALNRYDDALTAMKLAIDLPHGDRKTTDLYLRKAQAMTKSIDNTRREVERQRVDQIRRGVEDKVNALEPVQQPKPEVEIRSGQINFQIAATAVVAVISTVYPEYPDALRQAGRTGRIALRVAIGPDGKVKNASVTTSQLPEMNAATIEAVKQWTFKSNSATTLTLTLVYALQ